MYLNIRSALKRVLKKYSTKFKKKSIIHYEVYSQPLVQSPWVPKVVVFLEICVYFLNSFVAAKNDSANSMKKSQILTSEIMQGAL